MNSQISKDIIKDLIRKLEITEEQSREIIKSEFDLVKTTMESYDYDKKIHKVIRLPKWGVFYVKMKKINKEDETTY